VAFDASQRGRGMSLEAHGEDCFGIVRASNTNAVLTVRFEGHTPAALRRIARHMMALLRRVKPDAELAGRPSH